MVQNAGLMFGDASSSFILAYMLTMARQKDGRVSIQQTSHSGVQHNRQGAANGLMCQTNCFLRLALTPAPLANAGQTQQEPDLHRKTGDGSYGFRDWNSTPSNDSSLVSRRVRSPSLR